jgi:hypothetical protein
MSIEIRLLKESEYSMANDLYNNTSHINRSAPASVRSYSEFSWEFINCPYGKAIYAGAWESEEGQEPVLVGVQSMILLKMITGAGKHVLSAKGEATLIDMRALMKHKKTDILKELFVVLVQECRHKGVEFIWGFNNIPATYKRLGFENPFKSSYGVLVLKPRKAYQNIVSLKSTRAAADYFKIALQTASSYIYSWKKSLIVSQKSNYNFNSELNENNTLFQNAYSSDEMIFLLQDKKYLDWKILQNPYDINYMSFQLTDENNLLVAQVICSIQKDVAFIEQTLFDEKINKKERQLFLKKILQSLKAENTCLVRYTGFNSNKLNATEMDLLKSLGFVFTGKGEWFTFKNLSTNSIFNPENIYLSRMYKQGVN